MIYFTVGKYLIAGGFSEDSWTLDNTEIVEFVKTNSTPSFGKLPSRLQAAVGTMLGNSPMLCAGSDGPTGNGPTFDSCLSFQNSQWSQSHTMDDKRQKTAGVKINSTTFWILGGYSGTSFTQSDTTEFIIQGKYVLNGPNFHMIHTPAMHITLSIKVVIVVLY